jgi:hypothetical protein
LLAIPGWEQISLPKRFYRGLVEVRISSGCDDPNITDVPLRIKS